MPARPNRPYRRDLKHLAVWPRRLGVLALVAAAVIGIGLPWTGVHEVAGYSPTFLGLALAVIGAGLSAFALWVRARFRHHHAHVAAERAREADDQKV